MPATTDFTPPLAIPGAFRSSLADTCAGKESAGELSGVYVKDSGAFTTAFAADSAESGASRPKAFLTILVSFEATVILPRAAPTTPVSDVATNVNSRPALNPVATESKPPLSYAAARLRRAAALPRRWKAAALQTVSEPD